MFQTRDHRKRNHKKEEIKKIGIGEYFKEIGKKITEKMSNVSINDLDETVVKSNMQKDDSSEQKNGIEPEIMEEGHDIMYEEQPHDVIKILVTRRTHVDDEEEDDDDTTANALQKVEKLVRKWIKKDMVKGVVHQFDNNITTEIENYNSWLSSTKVSGRK